jgi:peroxiredoxin
MFAIRLVLFTLLNLVATAVISADAEQSVEPLQALEEPVPAPDFELLDPAGQTHTLADYQGKVLVVNFWATWCPPCIREMPALQNLRTTLHEQGLEVLGINMGENAEQVALFRERINVDFPLLLDENMVMSTAWEVLNLPTTFIVDRKGMITYAEVGDKPWDDPVIVQQIEVLLAD